METLNNKPVIELDIDVNDMYSGMKSNSIVDQPATEIEFYMFGNQKKHIFETNDEKRIVTGPVMLANTPILRFNEIIGEYYVKFTPEVIFKMRNKYIKEGKMNNMNEQHNPKKVVEGVYMVESYIIGDKITSNIFNKLQPGTWIASYWIEDIEYWNKLKESNFRGFSLEGEFIEKYEEDLIDRLFCSIESTLSEDISEEEKEQKIKTLLNL